MICPNCLEPGARSGRRFNQRPTARVVEMQSLGEVEYRGGREQKWQCPECRAIHFEALPAQMILRALFA